MNTYGTGMSPYMSNHFMRVARNMNNYVAASAQGALRDGGNDWPLFSQPPVLQLLMTGLLAYGLKSIRVPVSVVHFGYRLGHFIGRNT